jgi:hypothetical protein
MALGVKGKGKVVKDKAQVWSDTNKNIELRAERQLGHY